MRAMVVSEFGSPQVLTLQDIPTPEPGPGEVRVRLYAAGVNPADTYIRSGSYAFYRPTLPYVPGFDGAGVVDKLGSGVKRLREGQRVFVASLLAARKTGAYGEMTVCDSDAVHPLPDAISFSQGAGLGVPAQTAYRALFQRARLAPGETVLIHGASGGVGTLAVQLAWACGARVIATAGSALSREMLRKLGAHVTLNHNEPGYLEEVADLTEGRGPDVIIEMLANVNLENDMRIVAMFGRVVIVGSRDSLDFTPRLMMIKESTLLGMALWNSPPAEYAQANTAIAAALEAGILHPELGEELPLEQAALAHRNIIEGGGKRGKMVLTME